MARIQRHTKDWGGPRPGAGRPLQDARTRKISITIPEDLLGKLDQQAPRQQLARSAATTYYLRRGLHQKQGNNQT